jgi:molecular chaperone GrpE (heat shock protein)
MKDRRAPTLAKWPFYLADVVLLVLAIWLLKHYPHPLPIWPAILMVGCVAGAALLAVMPYRMEYETAVRFAEADGLTSTVSEIGKVQALAEQIRAATGQWQGVQEHSARTIAAAKEIGDRMAAEAQSFAGFMQKANDSEKATLRLEVEKLRRGEGQWLQLLVHLLDHVFALYQAGARSGQPNLEAQLGQFQEACRDLVRRVGLAPFEAAPDEPFDAERHQVAEGQPEPAPETRVAQTLATGYTFQGQLLRRSLVAIHPASNGEPDLSSAVLGEAAPVELESLADEATLVELSDTEATAVPSRPSSSDTDAALAIEDAFRLEAENLTDQREDRRKA